MIRLALAVLVPAFFVCVLSKPDAASLNKCSGYKFYHDVGFLKYQEMPLTFEDAKQRCVIEGGILASPTNATIKAAMMELITSPNEGKAAFTGFSAKSNKVFFSVEGIRLSSIPHGWSANEPNNENNKENCISMFSDGTMADVQCDKSLPYVCFLNATNSRLDSLNKCGANDKDYKMINNKTGTCYKFHLEPLAYDDAAKTCEDEGGHLLIINGESEKEDVNNFFAEYNNTKVGNSARIGIRLFEKAGKWMTVHSETLEEAGYATWARNEPNNVSDRQQCGAVYRNGELDDIACDDKYAFICEKEAEINYCLY